jgi:hypothetical protein
MSSTTTSEVTGAVLRAGESVTRAPQIAGFPGAALW